jgi:hypothetical protein
MPAYSAGTQAGSARQQVAASSTPHLYELAAPNLGGLWAHGAQHGQLAAAGAAGIGVVSSVQVWCSVIWCVVSRAVIASAACVVTEPTHSCNTLQKLRCTSCMLLLSKM